jgi:hypothetical protein
MQTHLFYRKSMGLFQPFFHISHHICLRCSCIMNIDSVIVYPVYMLLFCGDRTYTRQPGLCSSQLPGHFLCGLTVRACCT